MTSCILWFRMSAVVQTGDATQGKDEIMADSKGFAIATLAGLLLVAVGIGSVVTYHKAAPLSAAIFSAATPDLHAKDGSTS